MKVNQIKRTVQECASCGWNHEAVGFKHSSRIGHYFECPLSKERVKYTPDILQTVLSILGKEVN